MFSKAPLLSAVCLVSWLLSSAAPAGDALPDGLILLRNDSMELGILPKGGGRVVLLRLPGGENLLKAHPEVISKLPEVTADSPYTAINGHQWWLGPQRDWWSQQSLQPEKKGRDWPPDPFLNLGTWEVLEQTGQMARLRSPESPISGVQMEETIELGDGGTAILRLRLRNIRPEPVRWDIWSNTAMVSSRTQVFVPLGEKSSMRIELNDWPPFTRRLPSYDIAGAFWWMPLPVPPEKKEAGPEVGKFFFHSQRPRIVAVHDDVAFIKETDAIPKKELHPNQSLIEIYREQNSAENVTELEFHSPYRELAPGETMEFRESWRLVKVNAPAKGDELVRQVKELLDAK